MEISMHIDFNVRLIYFRRPWEWRWNSGVVGGSTGEGWDWGCNRWNAW